MCGHFFRYVLAREMHIVFWEMLYYISAKQVLMHEVQFKSLEILSWPEAK
jgi:hypothetical protein